LFVVAKIIGSSSTNDNLLFHSKILKGDFDHYKLLSMIMTIAVLLRLATHEQICNVIMCSVN